MPLLQRRMKLYYWVVGTVFFLTVCTYLLIPYPSVLLGFFLGVFSCMLSFMSVYIKTRVVGRAAVEQSSSMFAYVITAFGVLLRYGTVVAALAIAFIFSATFHLWAVVAGYVCLYLFILVDMFFQLQKKRGEQNGS